MLTAYDTPQLRLVINAARTAVPAEKIFLLAVQNTSCHYENIFTDTIQDRRREATHYYLLVLPESAHHNNSNQWQDMIEHRCRLLTPVTALVLPADKFVHWLQAGQPFAVTVARYGLLCYDAGKLSLPELPDMNNVRLAIGLRRECVHYINRSAEFLKGSERCSLQRQWLAAAFLLHQSAEQAYIAITWCITGFRPVVHHLDKLHRYALPFAPSLARVFPQNSERENFLFRLLQKAYIDTRYTSGYMIREADLDVLTGRVSRLWEIAASFCER